MRITCTVALAVAAAATAQPLTHVRLDDPHARLLAAALERDGFDVVEGSVGAASLELVCSPESLAALRAAGLTPVAIAEGRPFEAIQRERQAKDVGDPVPPGYKNLAEIQAFLEATAARFPAIARVVDLTAAYNTPPTAEGRHLYAIKVSDNVNADEDEPAFLMVGAHHAREIVTPVIALDALERLTGQYGSNPTVTSLVNKYEIWIAPVWNPDGYNFVFTTNNLWRKNRRVFPQGVGVDQNRNYPFGWSARCAGSTQPTSDTYKGPGPASEAETQTMIAFSNDRRFAKVLDYHSYGRDVLWEYNCLTHPFASFLQSEAIALANACGYGGSNRAPSAEGEHQEWQLSMGRFGWLIETATEFQPAIEAARAEAAMVWPGTLALLGRNISLVGHVTDRVTGEPVRAAITYDGVTFTNGETNSSGGPFGRSHAFLPNGPRTVRFAAAGYVPASVFIDAAQGIEQTREVLLDRVCYADCEPQPPRSLDVFDFLCFQNQYASNSPYACNCDQSTGGGVCDVFDFLCFQNAFAAGCP